MTQQMLDMMKDGDFRQVMLEDEDEHEFMDSEEEVDESAEQYPTQLDQAYRERLGHILTEKHVVVSESVLKETIARLPCKVCEQKPKKETITEKQRGPMGGVTYLYECINGHKQHWSSSMYYGSQSLTGQLLALMILLSGLSYHTVALAARFINLVLPSESQFYRLQSHWKTPIGRFYERCMAGWRAENRGETVAIDTRYDSPGHSARYSTTICMDHQSKIILDMAIGDSRMCGMHSPQMEELNTRTILGRLVEMLPHIREVVSDGSKVISAMLQQDFPQICHSLDIWHKGKNLAKRILAVAKGSAACLRHYVKPVVNHFWFCSTHCNGDVEEFVDKWQGLLWHSQDVHCWGTGACEHGPLSPTDRQRPVLTRQSEAFESLRGILMGEDFLQSVGKYVNGRHTSAIEAFNAHTLLNYCPKQLFFGFDCYTMRCQLAVLDHNHHITRNTRQTQNGELYTSIHFNKRTRQFVAHERLVDKDFAYIKELMIDCLEHVYGRRMESSRASITSSYLASAGAHIRGKHEGGRAVLSAQKKRGSCTESHV